MPLPLKSWTTLRFSLGSATFRFWHCAYLPFCEAPAKLRSPGFNAMALECAGAALKFQKSSAD
jgi:hypothetical protein